MHPEEGLRRALIVAHPASKPCRQGKGALDHSVAGQEDEALPRPGQLDHLQTQATGRGILGGLIAGIALWSTKTSSTVSPVTSWIY